MNKPLSLKSLLIIQYLPAACSSSLMAFNDAMTDLSTGRIDYAVVGGASGIFRPQTSIAFQRLHMMSPDVSISHHSALHYTDLLPTVIVMYTSKTCPVCGCNYEVLWVCAGHLQVL